MEYLLFTVIVLILIKDIMVTYKDIKKSKKRSKNNRPPVPKARLFFNPALREYTV